MILKIKRCSSTMIWSVIDDIHKYDCGIYERRFSEPYVNPDFEVADFKKYLDELETSEGFWNVCVLTCRMKDGSFCRIEFDTQAFVLNDAGQTIDRIDVNLLENSTAKS